MPRTGLPASVTVSLADDTGAFTLPAHDLGESTAIAPADQNKTVLAGYGRPTGAPQTVTVEAFDSTHFDTLNGWQMDGELINVTLTFDDGSTKKAKDVGFTVREVTPAGVGDLDGWMIDGFTQAATVAGALDIAPAFGA